MAIKRSTIYDLAKELGVSPSYVSKALNNHPSVSESVKEKVGKAAAALNYRQNSHAANLRQGSTKTIGVIVPHLNQSFFSEAIAGIEEVCYENNHSLVICQSHESFERECAMIDTLVHQNVDCIIISVAAETRSGSHLRTIKKNNIILIQFDRHLEEVESHKVLTNDHDASYQATLVLVEQGYKKIAFLGGPVHLSNFKSRKQGYLEVLKEKKLVIPYNFIVDDVLGPDKANPVINELLGLSDPPDAFLTVSDHQSLAVLKIAESLGIRVPEQLGIFGFANEAFSQLIKPTLSSVDQHSKELGRNAASIYFETARSGKTMEMVKTTINNTTLIQRESSARLQS